MKSITSFWVSSEDRKGSCVAMSHNNAPSSSGRLDAAIKVRDHTTPNALHAMISRTMVRATSGSATSRCLTKALNESQGVITMFFIDVPGPDVALVLLQAHLARRD